MSFIQTILLNLYLRSVISYMVYVPYEWWTIVAYEQPSYHVPALGSPDRTNSRMWTSIIWQVCID